jgi:16S rRNA (guanine966-N2)-methyltransferase
MRITGGMLKNMELTTPKGSKTRPTSAKVREALMSMLMPWLDGAKVLDLFAGSGSFGIECASRGASSVLFVEQDFSAINAIKKNRVRAEKKLDDCSIDIRKLDLFKSMPTLVGRTSKFDIVWADPPYDNVLKWLDEYLKQPNCLLNDDGCFVLECSSKDIDAVTLKISDSGLLDMLKLKKYGDTAIFISERK